MTLICWLLFRHRWELDPERCTAYRAVATCQRCGLHYSVSKVSIRKYRTYWRDPS